MKLFLSSTIGKKIMVALTGFILFGFVAGHMAGNLQVFSGAEKINAYAAFLKATPPLLWGTRFILLVSVCLHFIFTMQLVVRNKASRPIPYEKENNIQASLASRMMAVSGLMLLVYIVVHIAHLTFGYFHPNFSHTDVYRNLVIGLSVKPMAIFYIVGMAALSFHLCHGIWSLFQTLGLNHEKYNCWRRLLAYGVAGIITVGYLAVPAAILFKVIK